MADEIIDGTVVSTATLLGGSVRDVPTTGVVEASASLSYAFIKIGVLASTGVLTASAFLNVTWGSGSPVIEGVVSATASLTGAVRANVGWGSVDDPFHRRVCSHASVSGGVVEARNATVSRSGDPAERPVIVYSIDAASLVDLLDLRVPENGYFLASPLPGAYDDLFRRALASPGRLGVFYRVLGVPAVRFVDPQKDEVVWLVSILPDGTRDERGLYRWNGTVWVKYDSMPERAGEGLYVLDLADPDGAVKYYLRLLGFLHAWWQRQSRVVAGMYDVYSVPDRFLPELAATFGVELSDADPVVQRRVLRGAVYGVKRAGLADQVSVILRQLGLQGYVREAWVSLDSDLTWTGLPSLRDNDPGLYTYVRSRCGVQVKENGASVFSRDFVSRPHGWCVDDQERWTPTSGVGIHVNRADGRPFDLSTSRGTLVEVLDELCRLLSNLVLPAHVFVKYIATDIPSVDSHVVSDQRGLQTVSGVPRVVTGAASGSSSLTGRSKVNRAISGTVTATAVLSGILGRTIEGEVVATAVLSAGWGITQTGRVSATASLLGDLYRTTGGVSQYGFLGPVIRVGVGVFGGVDVERFGS